MFYYSVFFINYSKKMLHRYYFLLLLILLLFFVIIHTIINNINNGVKVDTDIHVVCFHVSLRDRPSLGILKR